MMSAKVCFIDREEELKDVEELIGKWGRTDFVLIKADGGIGKTRLLQEIKFRFNDYSPEKILVSEIIDFDDRAYHISVNIGRKIALMVDEETFEPYLKASLDYRKMEMAGVSSETLTKIFLENNQIFINCYNEIAKYRRIILLFDTADALDENEFWNYLVNMGSMLRNTLILISGRDVDKLKKILLRNNQTENTRFMNLLPFNEKAGGLYIKKKQDLLNIELDKSLLKKLLILSEGRPIIIDLAVEWHNRDVPTPWLKKTTEENLEKMTKDQFECKRIEFECQLVSNLIQPRSNLEKLILLMSHIFPIDIKTIIPLLELSAKDAEICFNEAKQLVFVKELPYGGITLHDEMRRMIDLYVWPQSDPEKDRRRQYSKTSITHIENLINKLKKKISFLKEKENIALLNDEIQNEILLFKERIEIEQETWISKAELLKHYLFIDIKTGVKFFKNAFDEATQEYQFSFRQLLLSQIARFVDRNKFSSEEYFIINFRRAKHWYEVGEYLLAKEIAQLIISDNNISTDNHANILLMLGNIEIRLGNVNNGINCFNLADDLPGKSLLFQVKTKNALGWTNRLLGNMMEAKDYYLKAKKLCIEKSIHSKPDKNFYEEYAWILNNLSFVYSNDNKERRDAINFARSAIKHWEHVDNLIGLGAAYLVLGIAYYRTDSMKLGLEAFQKSLDIFRPLNLNDWLGQIYSWRGALYQDEKDYEKAKIDLYRSLEIGADNIKAMTLNRLGRVYMSLGLWEKAEKVMLESLNHAQKIPDFIYWLGSIGRLAAIASEKKEFKRYYEFEEMLDNFCEEINYVEKNSLGIAKLAISKLALGLNDHQKLNIIRKHLSEGITLVVEYGSYARTDIESRLDDVEKCFDHVNSYIIRDIGQDLLSYFSKKELVEPEYGLVTPIMMKWATWGKD